MFFCIQMVRVTENKDYNETLVLSLCEENNWRKITEQNKGGVQEGDVQMFVYA